MQLGKITVLATEGSLLTRLRGMARECGIDWLERTEIESQNSKTAAGALVLKCNLWAQRLGLSPRNLDLMMRGKEPRRKPRDVAKLSKSSAERLALAWVS